MSQDPTENIPPSKPFNELPLSDLEIIEKSKTEIKAGDDFQARCDKEEVDKVPESRKGSEITFEELQVIERSKTVLSKLPERLVENKDRIHAETKKLRDDKHLDSYEFFDKVMNFDYTLLDLPDLVYLKFKIDAAMAKVVGYKDTPCDNSKD